MSRFAECVCLDNGFFCAAVGKVDVIQPVSIYVSIKNILVLDICQWSVFSRGAETGKIAIGVNFFFCCQIRSQWELHT